MVMLVTLQEASEHLRRDTGDDDADLELKIKGASQAILSYLQDYMLAYEFEVDEHGKAILDSSGQKVYLIDSSGDYVVRDEVKSAVLILVGLLYNDRDGEDFTNTGQRGAFQETLGYLKIPRTVVWLLEALRKPVVQ